MKINKNTVADLFSRSLEIEKIGDARQSSRPQKIESGDLFYLKMPIPVPVTWCSVFAHSRDSDLWYCVPGDSFSLVAQTDVRAPSSDVCVALNFRCRNAIWIHAEDIDLSNRVDQVDREIVGRIRAMISEMATNPVSILADDEVGQDPDYADWIDELRGAVDALVHSLHDEPTKVTRVIGPDMQFSRPEPALSLSADPADIDSDFDTVSPELRQTRQILNSRDERLNACLYDDGVVLEWHPISDDLSPPEIFLDGDKLDWFSQQSFMCTRLLAWRNGVVDLLVNAETIQITQC